MAVNKQLDEMMEFIARIQGETGIPSVHIQRALAQSGMDISTATPNDIYKLVTGRDLVGPAQPFVPAPKENISMAIPQPSLEERVIADPKIQDAIRMAAPAIERINPELAARVRNGDAEAMMEVYRMVVKNKGSMPDAPARQMELPLGESPTGLIPFGVRGPGVPVGGLSGPGSSRAAGGEMINAPLLGLPGEPGTGLSVDLLLRRLGAQSPSPGMLTEDVDIRGIPFRPRVWQPQPAMPVGLPQQGQRRIGQIVDGSLADEVAPPGSGMLNAVAASLAGAAVGGAGVLGGKAIGDRIFDDGATLADEPISDVTPLPVDIPVEEDEPLVLESGNPADLAAETSPPPAVHEMVYPGGPPDKQDRMLQALGAALGGAQISPSEAMADMGIGDDVANSRRRNQAEAMGLEAILRQIERYEAMDTPWRGYGRLRSAR